jgi:hypothetical protein
MAKIIETRLVDDLDGTEAAETVRFGLDGKSFTIDLSKSNARALRAALRKYVAAASPERTSGPTRRRSASSGPDPKAVREWASKNKVKLSSRGRIPGPVLEQYLASR